MASQPSFFHKNIYCSEIKNPVLGTYGCNLGRTDCRMSASSYNHQMLINKTSNVTLLGLGRGKGIVFNQTKVEASWGRCSYIWDGASDRKCNIGCGMGAPGDKCDNNGEAYYNICPSTKKTCKAKDVEVVGGFCMGYLGGQVPIPPTRGQRSVRVSGPFDRLSRAVRLDTGAKLSSGHGHKSRPVQRREGRRRPQH